MDAGPEGFRDFVVARSPALARTAYLLTGDRGLAEDLLQEALTRVASRWSKLCSSGEPEPYVRKVLYHCAVDGWRRRRLREVPQASPAAQVADTGDTAEHTTQRVALQAALAKLTPKQRAVLVLRFFEDLTEAQTAATLRCSVSTVKSQTRHALQRLQELSPSLVDAMRNEEVDS
jgi:RNA polymerase sigma-70 factor (sigma-E family)